MHVNPRHSNHVRWLSGAVLLLALSACQSSDPSGTFPTGPAPVARDGQALASPVECGERRAGRVYDVSIPSPLDAGAPIGATVFEPAFLTGCESYPLVLSGAGFGSKRARTLVPTDPDTLAFLPFAPVAALVAAGYGVLSFDHIGHGETAGLIGLQDPEREGQSVLRVVDWAEANLDWLAYGSGAGGETDNLKLGAIGPSYGGMYQYMLLGIDPQNRLDAIVPSVTTYDMRYSLFQGDVIKQRWVDALFDGREDSMSPALVQALQASEAQHRLGAALDAELEYRSLAYWCDAASGSGALPGRAYPRRPLPAVNALILQSSRDTLFDLNEATRSAECLVGNGGDVRLFTVQIGHNSTGLLTVLGLSDSPTDPGIVYQPDITSTGFICGGMTSIAAITAFFDEHLKGQSGAASAIPGPVCLSLTAIDSLTAEQVQRGGMSLSLPDAGIPVQLGSDDAVAQTQALYVQGIGRGALAGIPLLNVTLSPDDAVDALSADEVIVYVGVGHRRAGLLSWDLVDNQLTAICGLGTHRIELSGVLEPLGPGDELGLMVYGANDNQYPGIATTPVVSVRLRGEIALPLF
ncbi:MAG: CocE/NonD family hydrolase [Nevskiales bacterium]|nr:CocE/NonD family hydrolase [Nevskiales bacterium]